MPKPADLPLELRNFAFRQAAVVDSGLDFRIHLQRLMNSADRLIATKKPFKIPEELAAKPKASHAETHSVLPPSGKADNLQSRTAKKWYRRIGLSLAVMGSSFFLLIDFKDQPRLIITSGLFILVGVLLLLIGLERAENRASR
ncbi:MAG TPA: hypothetical protein VN838_17480 [Bradyrhizobium sp.]|nr:hypothetical protein [Bradyrhizobium sp.]